MVILIVQAVGSPAPLLTTAVVLLVAAALGGLILLANDLRAKAGPKPLVVIHALAAVVAVGLILVTALR